MTNSTASQTSTVATPEGGQTWYEEFYAGIDRLDLTVLDRLCTADMTLQFANNPMDVGRDAVRAGLGHFFSLIGGMRHSLVKRLEVGNHSVLESVVQYTRLDGSTVDLPVATGVDRRDGLIAAQRIYIDLTPLFNPPPVI